MWFWILQAIISNKGNNTKKPNYFIKQTFFLSHSTRGGLKKSSWMKLVKENSKYVKMCWKNAPKEKKTFSVCGAAAFGKETHPVSYVVYSHHVLSSFYDLGNTLGQNKHIWFFLFVFELFLEINKIIEIQIYNIMIDVSLLLQKCKIKIKQQSNFKILFEHFWLRVCGSSSIFTGHWAKI